MRELLSKAKQLAETITDEAVKQALLKTIAVLEKTVDEFLSDVETGFTAREDLQL